MGKARMMRSQSGRDGGRACPSSKRRREQDGHARPPPRVTIGQIARALPIYGLLDPMIETLHPVSPTATAPR
jgi:hypothetical protein